MIGALIARIRVRMGCNYLNTREIDKFLKDWHDDAVFIYPGLTRASGEHRGKNNVRKWWMEFYEQFPKSQFIVKRIYIKNIMTLLASNQIALEWEVDVLNRQGESYHNHGVSLVDIRNAKITRFEDFIFDLETLKRAWRSKPALQSTGRAGC